MPLLATRTPQEAVNQGLGRPANCGITVVILWSRMGTPLPPDKYPKPDGGPYLSGTEWEYEDARDAGREVLVYRRTAPVSVDIEAPDFEERREQRRWVNEFFTRFRNSDGSFNAGVTGYAAPAELKDRLAKDLKALVARSLLPRAARRALPARTRPLRRGTALAAASRLAGCLVRPALGRRPLPAGDPA